MSVLRPETDEDRRRQRAIAERVARARGLRADHMGRFAPFDAYLVDAGEHYRGVVEVKGRFEPSTKWPTVLIEQAKASKLTLSSVPFGAPYDWLNLFAVYWSDGVVATIRAEDAQEYELRSITLKKARDRNDVGDPCHLVPFSAFTVLGRLNGHRVRIDTDTDWSLRP